MAISPSIYHVARRAGVSAVSVSRVFNGHPHVSATLRNRVLQHARRIAFTPKKRLSSIAVVVQDLHTLTTGGYVSAMVASITKQIAARDHLMQLIPIENLDLVRNAFVSGVIGIAFDARFRELRAVPNLPLLSVNLPMQADGIHSVAINHYAQGRQAAEHLIQRGHRQIAFFEKSPDTWTSQERLRGMRVALQTHRLSAQPQLQFYAIQGPAYEAITQSRRLGATAIINFSDPWILEATHIIQNILKLRIPADLSIICYDDYPVLRFMTPPHTAIQQPLEELGQTAVDTMLDLIKQASSPHAHNRAKLVDIQLEPKLIARESVVRIA
ncbi:MAG: LacI family DNA-binding transcriptional regulator [Verrucomicrobia bacterium]|nr:LacI family DNA-binding transcriptional regulator [Verrucomicrobiota bacterium]